MCVCVCAYFLVFWPHKGVPDDLEISQLKRPGRLGKSIQYYASGNNSITSKKNVMNSQPSLTNITK